MICISLANLKYYEIKKLLIKPKYFYELRLDLLNLTDNEIIKLIKLNKNIIITNRNLKLSSMLSYIKSGAHLIDIDYKKIDISTTKIKNNLIISYHNYEKTPKNLNLVLKKLQKHKSKYYKISTKANDWEDNFRLLRIAKNNDNLIVQGMGTLGLYSRVMSNFSYAYYKTPTALGQIYYEDLEYLKKIFI